MHAVEVGHLVEKLSHFLFGRLGARQSAGIIPMAHYQFAIGADERDQWLACMSEARGARRFGSADGAGALTERQPGSAHSIRDLTVARDWVLR